MKKIIATMVLILALGGNSFAVGVTYNFSPDQVDKIIEGTCYLYPNVETIDDPEWVDPEDGTEAPQIPKYTAPQWTKEKYRRIIIRDTRRGLTKKRNETQVDVDLPDDAVTTE